jgi:hypothetical protein
MSIDNILQIAASVLAVIPGLISWGLSRPKETDIELTKLRKYILDYLRVQIGILVANELSNANIMETGLSEEDVNVLIQENIKIILKSKKDLFVDYYKAEDLFREFRKCNKLIRFVPFVLIFCGLILLVFTFVFKIISLQVLSLSGLLLLVVSIIILGRHEYLGIKFKDICDRHEVISNE